MTTLPIRPLPEVKITEQVMKKNVQETDKIHK